MAGAWALVALQSALEERANNHGHQTQRCRAPSRPIAAPVVIGAEVSVATRFGFFCPYPVIGVAFLLTASGYSDVAKKGVTCVYGVQRCCAHSGFRGAQGGCSALSNVHWFLARVTS